GRGRGRAGAGGGEGARGPPTRGVWARPGEAPAGGPPRALLRGGAAPRAIDGPRERIGPGAREFGRQERAEAAARRDVVRARNTRRHEEMVSESERLDQCERETLRERRQAGQARPVGPVVQRGAGVDRTGEGQFENEVGWLCQEPLGAGPKRRVDGPDESEAPVLQIDTRERRQEHVVVFFRRADASHRDGEVFLALEPAC